MAADVDCRQQLLSTPCSGDDCFSFQSASQSHSLNADPCPDAMLTKHRRQHQFASRPSSTSESSTSLLESKLRHLLRNIEAHPTQTLVGAKGEQNFPSASLKQSDHRQTPELSATSLGEDGSVVNQQRAIAEVPLPENDHSIASPRMPSAVSKAASRESSTEERSQTSSESSASSSAVLTKTPDLDTISPFISFERRNSSLPPPIDLALDQSSTYPLQSPQKRKQAVSINPNESFSSDLASPFHKRRRLSQADEAAGLPATSPVDQPHHKSDSVLSTENCSSPLTRHIVRTGSNEQQTRTHVDAAELTVNAETECKLESSERASIKTDTVLADSARNSASSPSREHTIRPLRRGQRGRARKFNRPNAKHQTTNSITGADNNITQSASSLAPESSRGSPAPSPSRGSRRGFGGRGRGGWRGRGGRGGRGGGGAGKDRGDTPEPPHKSLLNVEDKLILQHIRTRQNELKKFFSIIGSHQRDILDQLAGRDIKRLLKKPKVYTKPLEYSEVVSELEKRQQEACDLVEREYHMQLEQADRENLAQRSVIERQFQHRIDGSLRDHADGAQGDILLLKNAHHAAIDETWTDNGSNVECYFPRYHEMPEPNSHIRGYDSSRIYDEKPFKKHLNTYDEQAQREVIDYDVVLPIAEALAERRAAEKMELDRQRTQNLEELSNVAQNELAQMYSSRPTSQSDNPQFALSRLADIADMYSRQEVPPAAHPPAVYLSEPPPHFRQPFPSYDPRPPPSLPPPFPMNTVQSPQEPQSPFSSGRRLSSRRTTSISIPSKRSSVNEETSAQVFPTGAPAFGPLAPLAPASSRMPPPPPSYIQQHHSHYRQSSTSSIPPPPTPPSAGPYSRPQSSHAFSNVPATAPTPIATASQPLTLPPLHQASLSRPPDSLPPVPPHASPNGLQQAFGIQQPPSTQHFGTTAPPLVTAVSPVQSHSHRGSLSRAPPPPPPPPPPPAASASQINFSPTPPRNSFLPTLFDRRPSQPEPPAQTPHSSLSLQPSQPAQPSQSTFSLQQRPQQQPAQPPQASQPLPMQSHQTRFSIHTPGTNARVPISRDPNSRRLAGNRITFTPAQTPQDNRFKHRTASPRPYPPPPINTSISRRASSRNQSPSPQTAGPPSSALSASTMLGGQQPSINRSDSFTQRPPTTQNDTAANNGAPSTPSATVAPQHQRQLSQSQQHLPLPPPQFQNHGVPPTSGPGTPVSTLPGTNKMHNTFVNQTLESRAQAEVARANAAKTQGIGMGPKGGKRVLLPKM